MTRLLAMVLMLHPLHTTMTELTVNSTMHTVRVSARMFVDDFDRASRSAPSAAAYVARRISVLDASKRAIALRDCGTKQTAGLLQVCVEGSFAGDASALRVSNTMLCELFDDQVNIVQVVNGARRRSVLFVKGDPAKSVD